LTAAPAAALQATDERMFSTTAAVWGISELLIPASVLGGQQQVLKRRHGQRHVSTAQTSTYGHSSRPFLGGGERK
jgi:hypothetical protein